MQDMFLHQIQAVRRQSFRALRSPGLVRDHLVSSCRFLHSRFRRSTSQSRLLPRKKRVGQLRNYESPPVPRCSSVPVLKAQKTEQFFGGSETDMKACLAFVIIILILCRSCSLCPTNYAREPTKT